MRGQAMVVEQRHVRWWIARREPTAEERPGRHRGRGPPLSGRRGEIFTARRCHAGLGWSRPLLQTLGSAPSAWHRRARRPCPPYVSAPSHALCVLQHLQAGCRRSDSLVPTHFHPIDTPPPDRFLYCRRRHGFSVPRLLLRCSAAPAPIPPHPKPSPERLTYFHVANLLTRTTANTSALRCRRSRPGFHQAGLACHCQPKLQGPLRAAHPAERRGTV